MRRRRRRLARSGVLFALLALLFAPLARLALPLTLRLVGLALFRKEGDVLFVDPEDLMMMAMGRYYTS